MDGYSLTDLYEFHKEQMLDMRTIRYVADLVAQHIHNNTTPLPPFDDCEIIPGTIKNGTLPITIRVKAQSASLVYTIPQCCHLDTVKIRIERDNECKCGHKIVTGSICAFCDSEPLICSSHRLPALKTLYKYYKRNKDNRAVAVMAAVLGAKG